MIFKSSLENNLYLNYESRIINLSNILKTSSELFFYIKQLYITILKNRIFFSKYSQIFSPAIRHYYPIMILNSADILLTQKMGSRLFSVFPAFLGHSNSIVAGGFPVQSYITRLTPLTSFTILVVTLPSTSHGSSALSAVMKSLVVTALSAIA